MPSFSRPVLTLCALAASTALGACADGGDRSLAQAPIYFGSASQTFGAASVGEPDSAAYVGLGGDALLPAEAPTAPLASAQTSGSLAPTGLAYAAGLDAPASGAAAASGLAAGGGALGADVSLATPVAGAAAAVQAGAGSGLGADVGLATPVAGATVQVAAAPTADVTLGGAASASSAALSTTGSVLGGVNRLAVTTTTVVTPIGPNLVANGATTVRRACVLRVGC